jgi:hypothetical protein
MMSSIKITVRELKDKLDERGSHYFSKKAMSFFGDRMSNYGVRSAVIDTHAGTNVSVWELYRKKPVKGGMQTSAYFDKSTLRQRYKKQ